MSVVGNLLEKVVKAIETAEHNVRNDVRAGLAETTNAVRITGARVLPTYPNALMWGGQGRLTGWSLRESSGGAPATVTVHDGRDTSAPIVATLVLPAGQSETVFLGAGGLTVTEAVYLAVSGAVVGALYLGAVD